MTMTSQTWTFDFQPHVIPGGHLITAQSHMVDRYKAKCARILLEPRPADTGTFTIETGHLTAKAPAGRLSRLVSQDTDTLPDGRWFIDMRQHEPENFAHFLNNHLPAFFKTTEVTGHSWDKAVLLLPANTPGYILKLAALFGLETLTTRKTIAGSGISFSANPWVALRSERATWAHLPAPQEALKRAIAAAENRPLPKKVFISRRKTRALGNAADVESWLQARGFEILYPEDLDIVDQMRLFREADDIVAIHGAALAPLLYCTPDARPQRLIEILPVAHMTDVYRQMASQVGCRWIGVQGRMKPEYVKGLYDLDTPFTAYSLDTFDVDPASLEMAFDLVSQTKSDE